MRYKNTRRAGGTRHVGAAEMKRIDEEAIRTYGMPSIALMENAGKSVACEAITNYKRIKKSISIFCGKGNNGGDGLVCARHLIKFGKKVNIYLLCGKSALKSDPAVNLNILIKMRQPIREIKKIDDAKKLKMHLFRGLIIDAIFGIGFKGKADKLSAYIIEFINSLNLPVISVDIPSGLDAATGRAEGPCIKAAKTVTFGLPKKGLFKGEGPIYSGDIILADIGLPNI